MTNFYRRLMYYGIGVGIGLLGVFFFFNNRGCSWLPGNRVKEMVAERIIYISDSNLQIIKNLNIAEDEIGTYVQEAEIHFSKSKKNTNPQIYHFEGATRNKALFVAQVVLYKDGLTCELIPNQFSSENTIPTAKGYGKPVSFPSKNNLFYSDSSAHTNCQRKALGIMEDSTLSALFYKNGKIDITKSNFENKPNSEYALVFKNDLGTDIEMFATYFKENVRLYKFTFDGDSCP